MADQKKESRTLLQRVLDVQNEARFLEKKESNNFFNYRFRGIDGANELFGPLLRKHRVGMRIDTEIISNDLTQHGRMVQMIVRVTFYDETGETWYGGDGVGEAGDKGDKATSKCRSDALKRFWFDNFALPTGDPDPDHDNYQIAPNVARGMTDKDRAYAKKRIANSQTIEELNDFWKEAKGAGVDTPELDKMLIDRRAEIQGDLVQQAMNGHQVNG